MGTMVIHHIRFGGSTFATPVMKSDKLRPPCPPRATLPLWHQSVLGPGCGHRKSLSTGLVSQRTMETTKNDALISSKFI